MDRYRLRATTIHMISHVNFPEFRISLPERDVRGIWQSCDYGLYTYRLMCVMG